MEKIKNVFSRFGYDPIETPSIEFAETILGKYGDEGSKLVYRFQDNGKRDVCLRYDQTVPFARVVAANYKNLPMPFKRYQIGKVWRADRPAKGRYREFYQCDIDIIGTKNLLAEVEIAKVITAVLSELGIQKFVIRFNSRRLINDILNSFKIPLATQTDVIRLLDKLDKVGIDEIRKELKTLVSVATSERLLTLLIGDGSTQDKLRLLKGYNTTEIKEFLATAKDFKIPDTVLVFDPSLARGLDYYTGIIFEVFIPDVQIGAVCAGGRYDDLCSMFCAEKFSGVGVAFGFDRIIVALEELKLLDSVSLSSQVLIAYFGQDTLEDSIEMLTDIQSVGVKAEIYFDPNPIAKQLKYANKKSIPFVVMYGSDEKKRGEVTIKMMKTGKQKTIPKDQLVNYFKGYSSI